MSSSSQCREIYGMAAYGGIANAGAIFKADENGENFHFVHSIDMMIKGQTPNGDLCLAKNGKLYGTTISGGINYNGVLFEFDPGTGEYREEFSFNSTDGSNFYGGLVQADNGKLYGITNRVIYEWDPDSDIYTKKYDFSATDGRLSRDPLVKAKDGSLYGVMLYGGSKDLGVLFKWDVKADTFIKILDFEEGMNGYYPLGPLLVSDNNKLYGIASRGGSKQHGAIFEYDPIDGTFNKKIDFSGVTGSPAGPLMQANNGKYYGLSYRPDIPGKEFLYEWDSTRDTIRIMADFFTGDGAFASEKLIQANNGKMYGLTRQGGDNATGVIFEYDPVSENVIRKYDFAKSTYNFNSLNGSLCKASNGKLYALRADGGPMGNGVLFEWDPINDSYRDVINFYMAENGRYFSGIPIQARNRKLYGMGTSGGIYNQGVIFEWDPDDNIFIKKIDFNGLEDGGTPRGSLILGDHDKLFGLTEVGGKYHRGVLFVYIPETNLIKKLYDFEANLVSPSTPVIASNGKLYGTYDMGGANGCGGIFEWDPVSEKFATRYDFEGIVGFDHKSSLKNGLNGKLYGTAGNNTHGTIYEWDPANGNLVERFKFNTTLTGLNYGQPLLLADNGIFYGTTGNNGHPEKSIFFGWNPATNIFSEIFDFGDEEHGSCPYGQLIQSGNGKIYGTTFYGGKYDDGILYEYDYHTNTFEKKFDFNCKDGGCYCEGGLIEIGRPAKVVQVNTCGEYISPSGKFTWTTTGIYTDTIPNATGCDSIITVNLTVGKSSSSLLHENTCDKFNFNGKVLTSSGTYYDTIPNASGCDSLITLDLRIHRSSVNTIYETACTQYNFNGRWLNASGTYVDINPNSAGCDSITVLFLTISGPAESTIHPIACDSYTSPSGQHVWTENGTYSDTITSATGCDSIITVDLHIDRVDASVIQDRTVLISADLNADHQWIDCDNGYNPIPGETYLTYTALKNGHYAVIVSNGACVDTSGIYEILLTGVTDTPESRIILYPNPTSGNLTIDLGRVYPEAFMTITRSDGQIIRKESIKNIRRIEMVLDEPPGIFLVTVIVGGREMVFRVVKT
jgi:uncharacterized repeat protein (TIGR03803 family)